VTLAALIDEQDLLAVLKRGSLGALLLRRDQQTYAR
jgi:hypothetical protein